MAEFGRKLFEYIKTLVPDWRVSDDAWALSDESHLCGIGVLRNYGGEVMVIEWTPGIHKQVSDLRDSGSEVDFNRVVIVVDDHAIADWLNIQKELAPINVIPWSKREGLAQIVISDQP
jgi:hypothetical protein